MTPMTINFRKNKMFCDSRFHKKTLSFNIMVTAVADFFEKILLLIIIFIIILNYFLLCTLEKLFIQQGKTISSGVLHA